MHAPHTTSVAIGLGSNVGDRAAHLRRALARLGGTPATRLVASSRFYETAPVGPVPQGPFLNAAALLSTSLRPRELLAALHEIERDAGRERSRESRWGPRTLDLDILLFGDLRSDEPGLTLPHPRLHQRAFVLTPLAEIAPDLVVPGLGRTVRALAELLLADHPRSAADVRPWNPPAAGE